MVYSEFRWLEAYFIFSPKILYKLSFYLSSYLIICLFICLYISLSKKWPPTLAIGLKVSFKEWGSAWMSLFPEEREKMVSIKRTNRYKHDITNKYSIFGEFLWGSKFPK